MWKWVSFIGRWVTTAAFAAASVAASVKPEDAVSNLAAWWQYITATDAPALLKASVSDRIGFVAGLAGFLVSGCLAWRAGRPWSAAPGAANSTRIEARPNTVAHALSIEFGKGDEFEDNSVRPGGKRIRTVKVALRNVGNGLLKGCSLRVVCVAPRLPEGSAPLPLLLRSAIDLGREDRRFIEVAEYVESDPDGDYPWPVSLRRAYLGGIGTSHRADLPIDTQRREYEITLEATASDSKERRANGRLYVDQQNRLRLEPI